jgi:hypothetical protein
MKGFEIGDAPVEEPELAVQVFQGLPGVLFKIPEGMVQIEKDMCVRHRKTFQAF